MRNELSGQITELQCKNTKLTVQFYYVKSQISSLKEDRNSKMDQGDIRSDMVKIRSNMPFFFYSVTF